MDLYKFEKRSSDVDNSQESERMSEDDISKRLHSIKVPWNFQLFRPMLRNG